MKFVPSTLCHLSKLITFLIIFLLSNAALAENSIIRCKTADKKNFRVWKLKYENDGIELWTLNADTFYPFCSGGFSVEFPNGLLCAFKKVKKVGTVATFIDIQKPAITDILIRKDTILNDPSTWKQKIENSCELILE